MTVVPIFVLLCGVGFCSFVSYNLVRMPALAPFAETLGAGTGHGGVHRRRFDHDGHSSEAPRLARYPTW